MPRRATPPSAANAARVRIEQHLVALARVGHQPERAARRTASCATPAACGSRCRRPPAPSSLQSNWNASPSSKVSGTKALVDAAWPSPWRHARMKSVTPRVAAVVALGLDLARTAPCAVRRSCFGRRASAFSACLSVSWNGVSFVVAARRAGTSAPAHRSPAQPLAHRVARQTRRARDLAHRLLVAEVHPPDLANHGHGDHSSSPAAQKSSRVG